MSRLGSIDSAVADLIGSGQTVLFIGAGFSLIPNESLVDRRDRKGLREFFLDQYTASLQDAPYDVQSMSVEDIVLYLRMTKGVSHETISKTLKSFLASSGELVRSEAFRLLRRLLTLRPRIFEAIVTTNWDKGIEASLGDIPEVTVNAIVADNDCLNYDPSALSVLKIHGDIDKPKSIILSSADFDLYEKEHPRMVERLRILFSTKHLVLLGYSGRDDNFRRIYRSLHHDLRGGLRGGWIVAPSLRDQEKLWAPTVNLGHIPTTADVFLKSVISKIATVKVGGSRSISFGKEIQYLGFEADRSLSRLAKGVKRQYGLREVWVTRLRDTRRPNRSVAAVGALYLEIRCRSIRNLAIGTGETMDALGRALNTSSFTRKVTVLPTIVLLAGPRGFKDPSDIAQQLVSRFRPGKAECLSLRLPDEEYISRVCFRSSKAHRAKLKQLVRELAKAQIAKAANADVIISSLRPPDWFGGDEIPEERTIPMQWVTGEPVKQVNAALKRAGVVAIHQMIPLDKQGRDVTRQKLGTEVQSLAKHACRLEVNQLKRAAASNRHVIVVAAHSKKFASMIAVLHGRLCNTLVIDEELANDLMLVNPRRESIQLKGPLR